MAGTIFPATTNTSGIKSEDVAWVSCDASDYPGYVTVISVLESVVSANATAAILYSRVNAFCNYTAGSGIASSYNRIYSMASARQSAMFQEMFASTSALNLPHATINFEDKLAANNGTGNGQGNMSQQQPGGPSPSTAVAMIILYSITGVITALFLLIIVTGAIRAHRHPERYGPRAMLGRARQSRAKGLARAMLDSIPIVKFGDNEDDIPKPADVELAAAAHKDAGSGAAREANTAGAIAGAAPTMEEGEPSSENSALPRKSRESEDGIQADTAEAAQTTEHPVQAQGCSICTEDFERGEDVRVLPCNHKFHPPCIDPWLLNVSGTCPLCRIDLRPPTSGSDGQDEAADGSGPIAGSSDVITRLGVASEDVTGSRRHSHRLSFIFEPLNRRRMQDASPAERIEALRQYSQRHRTDDETRRRRRTSNRLSALLGRNRDQDSIDRPSRSETPVTGGAERPVSTFVDSPAQDREAARHAPISTQSATEAVAHAPHEAQATAGAEAPPTSEVEAPNPSEAADNIERPADMNPSHLAS